MRAEIEQHFLYIQYVMIAAIYMPGAMRHRYAGRLLDDVGAQDLAHVARRNRFTAELNNPQFVHALRNQAAVAP